jgi:hypothetical protein
MWSPLAVNLWRCLLLTTFSQSKGQHLKLSHINSHATHGRSPGNSVTPGGRGTRYSLLVLQRKSHNTLTDTGQYSDKRLSEPASHGLQLQLNWELLQ